MLRQLGGPGALVDAYLATAVGLGGLIVGAYAVLASLQLRVEEESGRAAVLLALPVPRWRWMAAHLLVTVFGGALLLVVNGGAAALAYGLQSGGVGPQARRLVPAALAQLPAVLVVAGLVGLLFGVSARATLTAWPLLAWFLVVGELGPSLSLPAWLLDTSPYAHLPRLPGGTAPGRPLAVLVLLGVAAALLGAAALRRRDLA